MRITRQKFVHPRSETVLFTHVLIRFRVLNLHYYQWVLTKRLGVEPPVPLSRDVVWGQ